MVYKMGLEGFGRINENRNTNERIEHKAFSKNHKMPVIVYFHLENCMQGIILNKYVIHSLNGCSFFCFKYSAEWRHKVFKWIFMRSYRANCE